jgi:hypothetical protein
MWHIWDTSEAHTGFWYGDMKERGPLEDLGIDGWIILKWIFKEWNGEAWTALSWLRIKTGGGHL